MILTEQVTDDPTQLFHVRIGEIRIAKAGILKATLGSCVAIAMLNRREGICGLAHCFLPFAPEGYAVRNARYADRAAANLLLRIAPAPKMRRGLKAFIAGGGRLLTQETNSHLQVGQMNVDSARNSLIELGIRFEEVEIGGMEGCNAFLDCNHFTFSCGKISNMLIDEKESPWN